ncbi:MAG: 3-deoxy-manno-octulosonate cytidylyltransferase [Sphingobacteriales bacterium]|nr:MAG: 3-deoxy-manno-octulosonate cytidylyltransferase [Sphingobacteriales bacterium]
MKKALAIIPARYNSSRLPGKPLMQIGDKPMLQHVYEQVTASGLFYDTIIATDDLRIYDEAQKWFGKVFMTSTHHQTGTDRCAEVINTISNNDPEIVVNIQGDEPFISAEPLKALLGVLDVNHEAGIATLVQKIDEQGDIRNPNVVKVAKDINGKALYFSRAAIPHIRDAEKMLSDATYWKHIGLYAFKAEVLREITKLKSSHLEETESLEQLRWLENGYKIYTAETDYKMLSVDTPEDLNKAQEFYLSQQVQKA